MKLKLKKIIQNGLVRWSILVDDNSFKYTISTTTKRFFHLKEGDNFFFKPLETILEHEKKEVFNSFLNYLAKREHSISDAKKWLTKRKIDKIEQEKLINYAQEKNFLNSNRYIDFYVRHCSIKGNKPLWQVKKDLETSGVSRDLLKNVDFNEKEALKNYILKRNLLKYDKQKIVKKLQLRGFDYKLINNVLEDIEEL